MGKAMDETEAQPSLDDVVKALDELDAVWADIGGDMEQVVSYLTKTIRLVIDGYRECAAERDALKAALAATKGPHEPAN